ncbi:class I SAM-dependent methyltransferase [Desulfolithobacter sp.]
MNITCFEDIDWNALWHQARKKKSWRAKGAEDWDRRAPSFARRTASSIYTEKFLQLLRPDQDWSVLDVGCGPGSLTLPLARKVRRVTALDFSRAMLDILERDAARQSVDNITPVHLSWTDDWACHGLKPHDLAIASRSMAVPDLREALEKLNAFATRRVCVTDRVAHGPMDPDAFAALGRQLESGPDYIYTVNLLYQLGYRASVDFIELEKELHYSSFAEAIESYTWMFRDLTAEEKQRLEGYIRSIATFHDDGPVTIHRHHPPTWAFISWEPRQERNRGFSCKDCHLGI